MMKCGILGLFLLFLAGIHVEGTFYQANINGDNCICHQIHLTTQEEKNKLLEVLTSIIWSRVPLAIQFLVRKLLLGKDIASPLRIKGVGFQSPQNPAEITLENFEDFVGNIPAKVPLNDEEDIPDNKLLEMVPPVPYSTENLLNFENMNAQVSRASLDGVQGSPDVDITRDSSENSPHTVDNTNHLLETDVINSKTSETTWPHAKYPQEGRTPGESSHYHTLRPQRMNSRPVPHARYGIDARDMPSKEAISDETSEVVVDDDSVDDEATPDLTEKRKFLTLVSSLGGVAIDQKGASANRESNFRDINYAARDNNPPGELSNLVTTQEQPGGQVKTGSARKMHKAPKVPGTPDIPERSDTPEPIQVVHYSRPIKTILIKRRVGRVPRH